MIGGIAGRHDYMTNERMNNMIKTIVTTTDENETFQAYKDEVGLFYMNDKQLEDFFSPYDVRILKAGELGNMTDEPQALIYMEDEQRLDSSPCFYEENGELQFDTVFDVSDFELMELESESIRSWLVKYPDSTVEEMRAIRRSKINDFIHKGLHRVGLKIVKDSVRYHEVKNWGQELKAYES